MTKAITSTEANKPIHRKKIRPLKKAPQAPKRFKSSYILFFIHVQGDIKLSLPKGKASAPEVSKRASEMWKTLSAEDRLHWDNEAAKEKQRYLAEKEVYTGPWQVPCKRAKKDPSAPKRNPSAFLLFSLTKRKELKEKNPLLKNTDISRILGKLWRQTSDIEKKPFIEREAEEREKYKGRMSIWREKKAKEDEEKKQINAQNTERVLAEKALEKVKTEIIPSSNNSAPPEDELVTFDASLTQHQPNRSDTFTPQSYRQASPLTYPSPYVDHYPYGQQQQQQGSWCTPDTHSHGSGMVSNHGNHHQMNSQYSSRPSHPYTHMHITDKYNNSFDNYSNQQQQQQQMFPEHSLFYEQSHQRQSMKIEEGADSPYPYTESYTEEFDPVPIH